MRWFCSWTIPSSRVRFHCIIIFALEGFISRSPHLFGSPTPNESAMPRCPSSRKKEPVIKIIKINPACPCTHATQTHTITITHIIHTHYAGSPYIDTTQEELCIYLIPIQRFDTTKKRARWYLPPELLSCVPCCSYERQKKDNDRT